MGGGVGGRNGAEECELRPMGRGSRVREGKSGEGVEWEESGGNEGGVGTGGEIKGVGREWEG